MEILTYQNIEKIHFWVPPQPCSLMLSIFDKSGEKIKIDMLPTHDDLEILEEEIEREGYTPPPHAHIPRRIYINEEEVELNSSLEKEVMDILSNLIQDNRLGHPQGLAVIMAQEMIDYFS